MSTKPKGPTPIVLKNDGPYRRWVDVPATSTGPDPYAPDARGVAQRQGQDVNTRKTRAQFRQIEFQRAILQHGYYLIWTKALLCPCVNSMTNQACINCGDCDGSGFYYDDPIEIRGIMTNMERNARPFDRTGAWIEGSSTLTVEPQYRMGHRDRVEMRDSVMVHSELFQKGDRRGLRSKLPANCDSLRYRISRMTALVWKPAPDVPATKLEEGYHFKVNENGWIEWLARGAELVEDEEYLSAIYEYHPIYLVISHPHATREATLETKVPQQTVFALPVQMLVQLDYLSDINTPLPSMCPSTLRRRMGET